MVVIVVPFRKQAIALENSNMLFYLALIHYQHLNELTYFFKVCCVRLHITYQLMHFYI